jgi:DNA-binding FrmR family transcriptional regulator
MTVDVHTKNQSTVKGNRFQTLTMAFAGLTICFAVFSIIIGNRLATLRADHIKAIQESKSTESESFEKLRTDLTQTQTDLTSAKKKVEEEQNKVKTLLQQLAAMKKELDKTKADLNAAQQAITSLEAKPVNPLPSNPLSTPEDTTDSQPPAPKQETGAASQKKMPPLPTSDQNLTPDLQKPAPVEPPATSPSTRPNASPSEVKSDSSPIQPAAVQPAPQAVPPVDQETVSDVGGNPSPEIIGAQ